ncbi:hypothetical protein [Magnetospirillum gryphiswaldense]|uniref:Uncharacterized protein n=1 Tax=Magnetospirillum gryphiswaldense TaxID=55518 RepID=A4U315_9PROT|nr:hypothetical protein [Magnetospirillum gryphiswaldense]CAM77272.1 hypothetical protein MGR_2458 [Magnetospirillum gryphiswaldense MSR-1]
MSLSIRQNSPLLSQPLDGGGVILRDIKGHLVGLLGHSPNIIATALSRGLDAYLADGWFLGVVPQVDPDALPITPTHGWRLIRRAKAIQ